MKKLILISLLLLAGAGCSVPVYRIHRQDTDVAYFVEGYKEYQSGDRKCVRFVINRTHEDWCGDYDITEYEQVAGKP